MDGWDIGTGVLVFTKGVELVAYHSLITNFLLFSKRGIPGVFTSINHVLDFTILNGCMARWKWDDVSFN